MDVYQEKSVNKHTLVPPVILSVKYTSVFPVTVGKQPNWIAKYKETFHKINWFSFPQSFLILFSENQIQAVLIQALERSFLTHS